METFAGRGGHSFTVLTDLEYLHRASCLYSQQAQQALVFTWFNFVLSYQPCSKKYHGRITVLYKSCKWAAKRSWNYPITGLLCACHHMGFRHGDNHHAPMSHSHSLSHDLLHGKYWWPNMIPDINACHSLLLLCTGQSPQDCPSWKACATAHFLAPLLVGWMLQWN